jgi:enamine deaminase RidA (YjgF/YER057c/UK114 family)
MSAHRIVNPETLAPARGFSHALVAEAGHTIYLGGQTAHDADGALVGDSLAEQFDAAAGNLVRALGAVGAEPSHLASLHIYVTEADAYREALPELGVIYRKHFGKHYPAAALLEVSGLFDPGALIELVGVAVVPYP